MRRAAPPLLLSVSAVDAISRRDHNSKDLDVYKQGDERIRSREDDLGLLDPAAGAAAVPLLGARCDLHLAQTKGFARDVVPVWNGHRRETASRRCGIATTPSTQLEKTDAESALDLLLDGQLLAMPPVCLSL